MKVSVEHWDAFATKPGKGNPAGIVLDLNLSDSEMQAVSRTIGFNDTAFVTRSDRADFKLRYFAPNREVDLCGHATIAAFAALHRDQRLPTNRTKFTLETRTGVLPIEVTSEGGLVTVVMTQANSEFAPFTGSRAFLAEALGIRIDDFHPSLPLVYGSTGRWTLVVPVKDLDAMRRMRPTPERFAAVIDRAGASIHPFCLETVLPTAHMHARHFSSPASGTLEDAVTGTASGVLCAYYRTYVATDAPQPLLIEQGFEVNREGTVKAWADRDGTSFAVRIAGNACFVDTIELDSATSFIA